MLHVYVHDSLFILWYTYSVILYCHLQLLLLIFGFGFIVYSAVTKYSDSYPYAGVGTVSSSLHETLYDGDKPSADQSLLDELIIQHLNTIIIVNRKNI